MRAIPRMQAVYFALNVNAGNTTLFPDVTNLIGPDVEVLGIMAYNSDQLGNAPDGVAVVSVADSQQLTVTFNRGSDQMFQDIPYTDLIRARNGGIWMETEPFPIDLTKCAVKVNGAAISASDAYFVFVYRIRGN